jgi:hypothetical protein
MTQMTARTHIPICLWTWVLLVWLPPLSAETTIAILDFEPSFLFAYLMGRLVDTRTGLVAANLVVEAKGQTGPVTERGAVRLAEQIQRALAAQGAPNPRSPKPAIHSGP